MACFVIFLYFANSWTALWYCVLKVSRIEAYLANKQKCHVNIYMQQAVDEAGINYFIN